MITPPGFSVVDRAPHLVDLLVAKKQGTDYRLKGSLQFDGSVPFVTLFTVSVASGFLDPSVDRRRLAPFPGVTRSRAAFDPDTYADARPIDADLTDGTQFWLVLEPVVGGVAGAASSPALVLTPNQRHGVERVLVQGTAPAGADISQSLALFVGPRMTEFAFTNTSGAHSLFVAFDDSPEYEIPANTTVPYSVGTEEDPIVGSVLFVRGAGGAVAFTANFVLDSGLPSIVLDGQIVLPVLQIGGGYSIQLSVGGAAILPHLLFTGSPSPRTSLGGTLALPQHPLLSGTLSPHPSLGGTLTLPQHPSLVGSLSPHPSLGGTLTLPQHPVLSGSLSPHPSLAGTLTLPQHPVLSGSLSPLSMGGTLTLPKLQVSGGPSQVGQLLGHWSANGSATTANAPNRIPGATAGAFTQATGGDQPTIATLANGVKTFVMDGVNSDFRLTPVAALKGTGPTWYWALHVRLPTATTSSRTLFSEWSTGGASVAERMMIQSDSSNNLVVSVANNAITFASNTYAVDIVTQQNGMWLEVLFDGTQATAADRTKLFVNGAEVSRFSTTGSMPTSLQAGDAADFWLASQTSTLNRLAWIAHLYIASSIPTVGERAAIQAFEVPQWVVTAPPVVASLVAHWSASSGAIAAELPNRCLGTIGSMVQGTTSNQPRLTTTGGGQAIAILSGAAQDLSTPAVTALKSTGPKRYWAFQIRRLYSPASKQTFYAEGTAATRLAFSFNAATLKIEVADGTTPSNSYTVSLATQAAGMFLEVLYDSTQGTAADRMRVFLAGVELTRSATTGTMPTSLPASSATNFTLGSEAGANNALLDFAHVYVCSDIPTSGERTTLQTFEAPTWDNPTLVITGWLRLAEASNPGGGTLSVPDVLNSINPATSPSTQKPTLGVDANGLPKLTFGGNASFNFLGWPVASNRNNFALDTTGKWGFAFWLKTTTNSGTPVFMNMRDGFNVFQTGLLNGNNPAPLDHSVWNPPNGATRRDAVSPTNVFVAGTRYFVTFEYDGSQPVEADRCFCSLNGVKQAFNFSLDTIMPATSPVPTVGNKLVIGSGASNATPSQVITGDYGANIFILQGAGGISGGGLLTAAQRAALMNFEPLN